ncbi:meiotic mRNA stability protein kinase Ssn3p [Monosporozyma servazzii]
MYNNNNERIPYTQGNNIISSQSSLQMNQQQQPQLQQQQMYQNSQQNSNNRDLWQTHVQSQLIGKKPLGNTVHGRTPMLMANNDVFTIGPYKSRKDNSRISVLEKYEIIGYIAAGTYGKVYKARGGKMKNDGSVDDINKLNRGRNVDLLMNSRRESENKISHPKFALQQRTMRNLYPSNNNNTISSNNNNNNALSRMNMNSAGKNNASSTNTNPINNNSTIDQGNGNTAGINTPDMKDNSSVLGTPSSVAGSKSDSPNGKKIQSAYYAIKKFKSDKEGVEQVHYIGISQSACREMALCRELDNKHLTKLVEVFLERKNIYLVYEYAEHDLLQIIHFHSHPKKRLIPTRMVRSIMWQILDGVSFLHQNWILHRDLKPANIMVTADGCVKIGDLGLARKFSNLLQTLYTGDKVVVTIWYRAPELLLGARHYTPAIDIWAIGCIFAELIGLQPLFKGEEAKMDSKKGVPFQSNQMQRILEILGTPTSKIWKNLHKYPEFENLSKFPKYRENLAAWYHSTGGRDNQGLDLLHKLLNYDPITRIDAITSLEHSYFTNGDNPVCESVFEGLNYHYPARRIHTEDNDITNVGRPHKSRNMASQSQMMSHSSNNATLGGLGVNRRILAAAAAAAAAVSGNSLPPGSRGSEPSRKKRR